MGMQTAQEVVESLISKERSINELSALKVDESCGNEEGSGSTIKNGEGLEMLKSYSSASTASLESEMEECDVAGCGMKEFRGKVEYEGDNESESEDLDVFLPQRLDESEKIDLVEYIASLNSCPNLEKYLDQGDVSNIEYNPKKAPTEKELNEASSLTGVGPRPELKTLIGRSIYFSKSIWNNLPCVHFRNWTIENKGGLPSLTPQKLGIMLSYEQAKIFHTLLKKGPAFQHISIAEKNAQFEKYFHLGQNVYFSISGKYQRASLRKWYYNFENKLMPTRKGIAFLFSELVNVSKCLDKLKRQDLEYKNCKPCYEVVGHKEKTCLVCNPTRPMQTVK
jgi:hypothetical protein